MINGAMQADLGWNIPVYSYSLAGLILSPTHNRMRCGFAFDVGTSFNFPDPPGCGAGGYVNWCARSGSFDPDLDCAYSPSRLYDLMEARNTLRARGTKPTHKRWNDGKFYDEIIFYQEDYEANLPRSIEAVFYLHQDGTPNDCHAANADVYDGIKCEAYATTAHAAILSHFGLTNEVLPLLKLDLWDWRAPFSDHYEATSG